MIDQHTQQATVPARVGVADVEAAFGEPLGRRAREAVERADLRYFPLTAAEQAEGLRRIRASLEGPVEVAGPHRLDRWEAGWAENLQALDAQGQPEAIVPRYFGKFDLVRWRQALIRPASPRFEYEMLGVIQAWLFERYVTSVPAIYEFGCGTGHNLVRAGTFNPVAELCGLDWAESSQAVIRAYAERFAMPRLKARRFDYFAPDPTLALRPGAAVFTVASLEQVGDRHAPFIDWLLEQRPACCIHIEPIWETLDPNHPLDALSVAYMKKRNYLSGFLDRLGRLEIEGALTIDRSQRSYVGSMLIDGYSVVVWSPGTRGGTP